jgi:hypothetical protein
LVLGKPLIPLPQACGGAGGSRARPILTTHVAPPYAPSHPGPTEATAGTNARLCVLDVERRPVVLLLVELRCRLWVRDDRHRPPLLQAGQGALAGERPVGLVGRGTALTGRGDAGTTSWGGLGGQRIGVWVHMLVHACLHASVQEGGGGAARTAARDGQTTESCRFA